MTGSILTRINAHRTRHLERAAVEAINIAPNDKVLEIGYGRGDGLGFAYDKIQHGNGIVFGIDRSSYMEEVVRKRFCIEIAEEGRIRLDQAIDLSNLPYPSDFFAGIFHVDSYYFWGNRMRDICWDLNRVLKPEGILVCAMQLSR
uniref:Methyltransf_25 domain-containing protein n=1 Tax=Ascaris lumbricoides TaxID=6252 RepID=A0A0M3IWL9_ASCLU